MNNIRFHPHFFLNNLSDLEDPGFALREPVFHPEAPDFMRDYKELCVVPQSEIEILPSFDQELPIIRVTANNSLAEFIDMAPDVTVRRHRNVPAKIESAATNRLRLPATTEFTPLLLDLRDREYTARDL